MSFRRFEYYRNQSIRNKLDHLGGVIYGDTNIIDGDLLINGASLVPAGSVISYVSDKAPNGWLVCDGSEISIKNYSRLYNIIGVSFGLSSDPSNSFVLPDLRGRIPLGQGQGYNLTNRNVGDISGSETHTLTIAELPSHTHSATIDACGNHTHNITDPGHTHLLNMVEKDNGDFSNAAGQHPTGDANKNNGTNHNISTENSNTGITINAAGSHTHNITLNTTGGDLAHNIMQPYLVLNYIIRY